MTSYFLLSRNKNIENVFSKENILDLLKITFFCHHIFILPKMRFLVLTENIENEILLFTIFCSFEKIFSENVLKNPTKRIFITIFYFQ